MKTIIPTLRLVPLFLFANCSLHAYDATKSNYVGTMGTGTSIGTCPDRLNINLSGHSLKGHWLHCNSVEYMT